jgi:hypothetical protein
MPELSHPGVGSLQVACLLNCVHLPILPMGAQIYTGALDIECPGNLQGTGEARVVTEGACAEFSRELQKIYKSFGRD